MEKENETFTAAQTKALAAFEAACESHDLHAFGHGRKTGAHERVVSCFQMVEIEGVSDALTWKERAQVRDSRSFLGLAPLAYLSKEGGK